jgi:CMP-N-acetylneuraminic acid synthetase
MNDKVTIAALVPMRHHSQRVEGKNYRLLGDKPLFHHILHTLMDCPQIDAIVVDTDSQPIMDGLRANFPRVQIIERPPHLRADAISMNEILAYDASRFKADFYLQTHSTNPLLRAESISNAIQTMLANYPAYDSLFSVTRVQTRLWDQLGRAINHNPDILLQTQDLPPVYEENSCIYIFTESILNTRRNRLGNRPMLFEIPPNEAWDIDDEIDFQITEFLLQQHHNSPPSKSP